MAGKQSFKKSDQQAIRGKVAKLNQGPSEIAENVTAYIKGVYAEARKLGSQPFRRITLSPTMGAGVRLDLTEVMEAIA